jgi:hypothetical protein
MRIRYFLLLAIITILSNNCLLAQQGPVELVAKDTAGILNKEITVDITVNGFTNIISFQASINWDPTLLTFKEVSNFGIADFGPDDFGITAADQGHVRFLWTPDNAIAVSLVDGSTLFTATFEVISDNQPSAVIGFIDNVSNPAFDMEFANDNYEVLDVNTTNGIITIFSSADELVNIVSFPNTSCDEKVSNGRLEADVNGNTNDFTFQWFIGTEVKETPDFTGNIFDQLLAGDYTLRVMDKNNQILLDKKNTSVLDIPAGTPNIISEIMNAPQVSCSDDPVDFTGSIEIAVNDEQPAGTYTISWWKGDSDTGEELVTFADGFSATNLASGNYEVVVENPATTCKSYLSSSVVEDLVEFSLTVSGTDNNFCEDGSNGSTSAEVIDATAFNLRYFWFMENDAVDTTMALAKGPKMENVVAGNYKSFVMDVDSKCIAEGNVTVDDVPIIPDPVIALRNDTLFANYDNANWLKGGSPLNQTGPYYVPTASAFYSVSVKNEFNCFAFSEDFNFGITGLEENLSGFSIYPNPFSEYVHVSIPDGKLDNLQVFDTHGALLIEFFDVKQQLIDLHLNGSSNGIYLIKIQKDNKIITRKIVKNATK